MRTPEGETVKGPESQEKDGSKRGGGVRAAATPSDNLQKACEPGRKKKGTHVRGEQPKTNKTRRGDPGSKKRTLSGRGKGGEEKLLGGKGKGQESKGVALSETKASETHG